MSYPQVQGIHDFNLLQQGYDNDKQTPLGVINAHLYGAFPLMYNLILGDSYRSVDKWGTYNKSTSFIIQQELEESDDSGDDR